MLHISPGMALDPQGRELVACAKLVLQRDTDMFWLSGGIANEPPEKRPDKDEASYLLAAHYAERWIDGVLIEDGRGESICEANRVCETVVFSLTRRLASDKEQKASAAAGAGRAGGADDASSDFAPCRMETLSRKGGVDVDLEAAVPLALVTVKFDRSGAPVFDRLDARFRPRRLVPSFTVAGEIMPDPDPNRASRPPRENKQ